MLRRIKGSLKYRLFYGYSRSLERLKRRRLTRLEWPESSRADLPPLLIVTCEKDISLLLYSLRSLRDRTTALPRVWLVGDSDEAVTALQKVFPTTSKHLSVSHWDSFLQELAPVEKQFVEVWVKSRPWGGYARKYAVTLAANRKSQILLSDADVLWKGDLFPRLEALLDSKPSMLAGRDEVYAYDRDAAGVLKSNMFSAPPLNCGFVYYSPGILSRMMDAADYGRMQPFAANASTHLEQTLIAYAFHKAGGKFFANQEVAATLADNFCLTERVSATVRHYAGAKHLFWRDA